MAQSLPILKWYCEFRVVADRATLGQLAELAYCRIPANVQRSSRTSSIAPQLPGYVSGRRNMSRMSVELLHTVWPTGTAVMGASSPVQDGYGCPHHEACMARTCLATVSQE